MDRYRASAIEVIERCRRLASHSEELGFLTRTFLSPSMRSAYNEVGACMERAGMDVHVDCAGNLRGHYPGAHSSPPLLLGSHLDTVPRAGMFDGALGVEIGIELVKLLDGRRLKCPVEVIGFSEEEGVRFGVPFIGSLALIGELDSKLLARRDANGISVRDAIHQFGPDSAKPKEIVTEAVGYLEFHIEQGPVLDNLQVPLAVVETIVGQSRLDIQFTGHANHAGTTPMRLRRDALAGAAEWIVAVERLAADTPELVATVGRMEVQPGSGNIVPGQVTLSLDVRHPNDEVRVGAVDRLLQCATQLADRRGIVVSSQVLLNQPAVKMNDTITNRLACAVTRCGYPVHRMNSGAGHDAMIAARRFPAAMLFLRSPGGVSHHPDESVMIDDVAAALAVGIAFFDEMEAAYG